MSTNNQTKKENGFNTFIKSVVIGFLLYAALYTIFIHDVRARMPLVAVFFPLSIIISIIWYKTKRKKQKKIGEKQSTIISDYETEDSTTSSKDKEVNFAQREELEVSFVNSHKRSSSNDSKNINSNSYNIKDRI